VRGAFVATIMTGVFPSETAAGDMCPGARAAGAHRRVVAHQEDRTRFRKSSTWLWTMTLTGTSTLTVRLRLTPHRCPCTLPIERRNARCNQRGRDAHEPDRTRRSTSRSTMSSTSTFTSDDSSQVHHRRWTSTDPVLRVSAERDNGSEVEVDGGADVLRIASLPSSSTLESRSTSSSTSTSSATGTTHERATCDEASEVHIKRNDGCRGQGPGRRPSGDAPEAGPNPLFDTSARLDAPRRDATARCMCSVARCLAAAFVAPSRAGSASHAGARVPLTDFRDGAVGSAR
jgi:hypothetical protein